MRPIKKLLITTMIAALVITGCGASKSNTPSETELPDKVVKVTDHLDDGRTVVGISMPDRLLERWNRDGVYLQDEFEKRGCDVILRYANNLIDNQISNIRDMIEGGADILVITAVDGAALTKVLNEAKDAGVTIIAYDRLIMDTDSVDYYVSFDNYMVGVLQAEYVIEKLALDKSDSTKYIEFVTGDPVDNNARFFYSGAMDTLSPYLDSGKLSVRSGQSEFYETATAQWSTDIAQQRLQIILNSYYPEGTRLDAVLCANDSTALGAARALESDYLSSNHVVLTGQDADVANVYNILEGTQNMTVYKHLPQESVVTVDLCMAILNGLSPNENLITNSNWDFDCTYNTTDYNNGNKVVTAYLLRPIAITEDNIEKELFESGYYSRNSSGLIYVTK